MRRIFYLLLAVCFLTASSVWAAPKELRIFMWSEYIDPEIPKQFEKETGIKVKIDLYESNEDMIAKLQAGGIKQYDLINPSDYAIPALKSMKLIQPLDHSKIPNMKNIDPIFTKTMHDPGNQYTVPWQWGTVGLLYRKDMLKNYENTWAMLFDPKKNPGNFLLIDSVREMLGIPLLYLGYNFNSSNPKELAQVAELLSATKKRDNCRGFEGGVGGKNAVVAGTAAAAIVYNGDAVKAINDNPDVPLVFTVPKEGSELWVDSLAIPAKAPNPEAAYKFINYILDPKVGAQLSDFNQYATPNLAARKFINPDDLKNPAIYPDEKTMKTLHMTEDLGSRMKIIDEAWTRVKSH